MRLRRAVDKGDGLRNAEVDDFDGTAVVNKDVFGLDVTMNDPR
jgi:hypothetical protein